MHIEEIEKFLDNQANTTHYVKIDFKKRDPIYGIFIRTNDYNDLKAKNFWRIVTRTYYQEFKKTKNNNLAKIFNGMEFSKLSLQKTAIEDLAAKV